MDLDDTPQQAEYRARVRAWIEAHKHHAPPPIGGVHAVDPARYRRWQAQLAEARLVGVTWPEEYGGAGLGPVEQLIVSSELRHAGCGGIADNIAISIIGPTIIARGTAQQKDRYLGPMLHGEEGWSQVFSEPAAGSDLAALQTRAKRVDGGFRLTGQKVWTTMAEHADFGMLLARTNPDVPKHNGLTMYIVPMNADGVIVRPLRGIEGGANFNEVFLDDVLVDDDHVLGGVDEGWDVALTALMYERLSLVATFDEAGMNAERFVAPLAKHPELLDSHARQRLAEVTCRLLALRFSGYRTLTALSHGRVPGPESALGKLGVVEAARQGCELIADVLGPGALDGEWGKTTCDLPGLRSGGGTDEILRNMLGERVLGLPPEPRADKGIPFSEFNHAKRNRAVTAA
jgi:alkylation response protein AidB-like acyl-CoA dehydrogenase